MALFEEDSLESLFCPPETESEVKKDVESSDWKLEPPLLLQGKHKVRRSWWRFFSLRSDRFSTVLNKSGQRVESLESTTECLHEALRNLQNIAESENVTEKRYKRQLSENKERWKEYLNLRNPKKLADPCENLGIENIKVEGTFLPDEVKETHKALNDAGFDTANRIISKLTLGPSAETSMLPDLLCAFLLTMTERDAESLALSLLLRGNILTCNSNLEQFMEVFTEAVETYIVLPSSMKNTDFRKSWYNECKNWFRRCFFDVLPFDVAFDVINLFIFDDISAIVKIGLIIFSVIIKQMLLRQSDDSSVPDSWFIETSRGLKTSKTMSIKLLSTYYLKLNITKLALNQQAHLKYLINLSSGTCHPEPFSFKQYGWIGFDLDHTLIEYNKIEEVLFKAVLTYLSKWKIQAVDDPNDWLATVFSEIGKNHNSIVYPRVCPYKGVIVDKMIGNIIQLDIHGDVINAFHGKEQLAPWQIRKAYYPPRNSQKPFNCIVNTEDSSRFSVLHTRFDEPFAAVLLVIAEYVKADKNIIEDDFDWKQCCKLLGEAFLFVNGRYCTYGLETQLNNHIDEFIPKQPDVLRWLNRIKRNGIGLFLITNSRSDHADKLMSHAYGSNWRKLFDIIICSASKTKFFSEGYSCPFHTINFRTHRAISRTATTNLEKNKIFSNGNVFVLNQFLLKSSPSKQANVLYFGDHVVHDVVNPKEHSKNLKDVRWDSVAVIADAYTQYYTENQNPMYGPNGSRTWLNGKVCEHSRLCVDSIRVFASKKLRHKFNKIEERHWNDFHKIT